VRLKNSFLSWSKSRRSICTKPIPGGFTLQRTYFLTWPSLGPHTSRSSHTISMKKLNCGSQILRQMGITWIMSCIFHCRCSSSISYHCTTFGQSKLIMIWEIQRQKLGYLSPVNGTECPYAVASKRERMRMKDKPLMNLNFCSKSTAKQRKILS